MTKRKSELLVPQKLDRPPGDSVKMSQVWLRISAFLSLKSTNTQRTYSSIVTEWCEFLGAPAGSNKAGDLIISAKDLNAMAYKAWLEKQIGQRPRVATHNSDTLLPTLKSRTNSKRDGYQSTLSNATIRKKIAALRRIYRMLLSADLGIRRNPFDTDSLPAPSASSGQKRPTEMLDFKMVKRVVEAPKLNGNKGLRDRAVLAVLFGGGLRRSEAVGIRLADVRETRRGTLYLRLRATKAKKDADQALPKWAAAYVRELIKIRRNDGAHDGDFLFVSYRGKAGKIATKEPLSDSGLYKLFKYYCHKVGAGSFLSPHSARATAITKLLEDGIGHREVQEFSRHASVQMVEAYDKRRIAVDDNPARDLDYEDDG